MGFGHLVEGMIGPYWFGGLYFGLGVLQNMIGQILYLFTPELPAVGASGTIYTIIMMAALFTPQDNIQFLAFVGFRPFVLNIPVLIGSSYFFWEFGLAMAQGFSMSTELLHASGALFGLIAGCIMLWWGNFDFDGRDVRSMIAELRD